MTELLNVRGANAFINGQPVFAGDMSDLLSRIDELVQERKPHLVVTANVDHVIDLQDKPDLAAAYRQADVRTVDGVPLLRLFALLGATGLHRLTGADLLPEVVANSRAHNWRVAILGGRDDAVNDAARKLTVRYPGSTVIPIMMPMVQTVSDPASQPVIASLTEERPDVVFICLGAPKQESWYMAWASELPPAVYIGAGAAVDFAADRISRAPKFAQRFGFEWVWRLLHDFRRLAPRYLLKGPRFIKIALKALTQR